MPSRRIFAGVVDADCPRIRDRAKHALELLDERRSDHTRRDRRPDHHGVVGVFACVDVVLRVYRSVVRIGPAFLPRWPDSNAEKACS